MSDPIREQLRQDKSYQLTTKEADFLIDLLNQQEDAQQYAKLIDKLYMLGEIADNDDDDLMPF